MCPESGSQLAVSGLLINRSQSPPPLFGIGLDEQTAGSLHLGQQLRSRVEDHDIEEKILWQRPRDSVRNQIECCPQRSHRSRHQPHEEHRSRSLPPFRNINVNEVGKGHVGARLEAVAEPFFNLVIERSGGWRDAKMLIRFSHPQIIAPNGQALKFTTEK